MENMVYNMIVSMSSALPMGFDLFNILVGAAMIVVGLLLNLKKKKIQWSYLLISIGFIAMVVNGLKIMSII